MPPPHKKRNLTSLRRQAGASVAQTGDTPLKDEYPLDVDALIHDLQTQQIELEMQNAELNRSSNTLRTLRAQYEGLSCKYATLFDRAPNAYVVFDEKRIISEANQKAAILFNLPKAELIGRSIPQFIHQDERETFHLLMRDSRNSSEPLAVELKISQTGGRSRPVQLQLQYLPQKGLTGNEYQVTIMDLSEQIRVSSSMQLLHQCLEIAVSTDNIQQLLDAYTQQIKQYCNCKAVGIRLRDEAGNIPYQSYVGFSRQFYESEGPLSPHNDQCMCIEVVKGRVDPSKPFFTPFGSFYTNGISRFLSTVPPEAPNRSRNVCNESGFESVALVPITIGCHISGLIHIADTRKNAVPLRVVEVVQQVAMRLGLALQRFHMQEKLYDALENQRALASHLLRAQEEEQRRIAMELHDQTGQDLNVLKLRLSEIKKNLKKDNGDPLQLCIGTLAFADHIIEGVRRITRGLNPAILDALGLESALRRIAREYTIHTSTGIETHLAALKSVKNRETQVVLFRIVQEALHNTSKHANATQMVIRACQTTDGLCIEVKDNGKGFDSKRRRSAGKQTYGMGLEAMKLRAGMIAARLTITSQEGMGTCVTLTIPNTAL